LDLTDASAAGIRDDPKSWPPPGHLRLNGFVFGRIAEGPKDAENRKSWLALQPETQPYLQLAKVLKAAGEDDAARLILEEMERLRRRQGDPNSARRMWNKTLDWSIRFGYEPQRAVWGLAILSALGWILYRRSYLAGGMAPTEKVACSDFRQDGRTPTCYEAFSPLVYSVENSLPLVKLGQYEKWKPDPDGSLLKNGKWVKSAGRKKSWFPPLRPLEGLLIFVGLLAPVNLDQVPSRLGRFATSPRGLRWFLWFQILLGWLLATLFLAGVTGIVHKD